ncbi:MAG TPA: tetratricopeptide repeat protein [Bryobacteraceae bacterium]|nr:tetratricopeptide repeat protein [Bryobacteraceae bacterium]
MRLLAACFFTLAVGLHAETYVVLPFGNAALDKNLDWIGESIADDVSEILGGEGFVTPGREDRVAVYHRLSLRPYARLSKASVIKIGEELDAEHVIYGEFDVKPSTEANAKSRGTLQITVRILDLRHLKQGPEFREAGALEDLAALQNHAGWQTLRFFLPNGPREEEFRQRHPPARVDALENYVRGLLAANPDEKHRFFSQSSRLDPSYTPPVLQLARLDWKKKDYKSAAELFQKIPERDSHHREAIFYLGLCRYYGGDFAGAQKAFQIVAQSVPLNEVFNNLGAAASRRNQPEALDAFRKALEGDGSDPAYLFNVGYSLWKQGKFEQAAEKFRAVLDHDPSDSVAGMLLARCNSQSGPRSGDTRTEGLERVKTNYEESQYWQLKAVLQPTRPE